MWARHRSARGRVKILANHQHPQAIGHGLGLVSSLLAFLAAKANTAATHACEPTCYASATQACQPCT
eukprot:1156201-Pelagomonas_calceolata.AAC.6